MARLFIRRPSSPSPSPSCARVHVDTGQVIDVVVVVVVVIVVVTVHYADHIEHCVDRYHCESQETEW